MSAHFTSVDHSLILLPVSSPYSVPTHLSHVISTAARHTLKRLLIVLITPESILDLPSTRWDDAQAMLTYLYVQATAIAQEMDNIMLDIDVLLRTRAGLNADQFGSFEAVYRIEGDDIVAGKPNALQYQFPMDQASSVSEDTTDANDQKPREPPEFPVVALGGTFDHLHAGHKILLSMAALLARRKLIIGVTDASLLGSKLHAHLLEPYDIRTERTRGFLTMFKPSLEYDLTPIKDVYGPTGWDPDIQGLVVSRETIGGGQSIAKHRAEHGLPPLTTFVIDVISHTERVEVDDINHLRRAKMSSTFIRDWLSKQK